MATGPITSWEIDGETVETVSDFIYLFILFFIFYFFVFFIFSLAPKSLQMVSAAMKLKDA